MAESASHAGAVVDNEELKDRSRFSSSPLPDFKLQLDNWLLKEARASGDFSESRIKLRQTNTIFSVCFGVWDIWKLVGNGKLTEEARKEAKESVKRSIKSLFEQLKILSDQWSGQDTKVIITLAPDVSFFPSFKHIDVPHKDVADIIETWNGEIKSRAKTYRDGTIYVLDLNVFLMDQLRERQLWVGGYINSEQFGQKGMAWENVDQPCLGGGGATWSLWGKSVCDVPSKYLFW